MSGAKAKLLAIIMCVPLQCILHGELYTHTTAVVTCHVHSVQGEHEAAVSTG